MIYKCVMCDTVFTQKPLLYMHFDTHLAKQKVHVFKCPDCTKLYAQKGSMMEHIKVRLSVEKKLKIFHVKENKIHTKSLPFINECVAFMCCPFTAFFSERGVSKGIQKVLDRP